ncbi:MAG: hypothetical protein FWG16_07105 [Micrococcales bacterium]|nr:hypothetical protein [Micrococcales bacterium]
MDTSSPETTEAPTEATQTYGPNPQIELDPPVSQAIPPATPVVAPQLPLDKIEVNTGEFEGWDVSSVQAFADDVAAGNVDKIVQWCWTRSPEDIRTLYSSSVHRGAVLEALAMPGVAAQLGGVWEGTHLTISFYHEELDSQYACPEVVFTPGEAQWRMKRVLAFEQGNPIHDGDGDHYWLVCDNECGTIFDPHNPNSDWVDGRTAPIINADATQWERLKALAAAEITVEELTNGFLRVRAIDGSTDALAYFTGLTQSNDWALAYLLGEII